MKMVNFNYFIDSNKKSFEKVVKLLDTLINNINQDNFKNFYYDLKTAQLYIDKDFLKNRFPKEFNDKSVEDIIPLSNLDEKPFENYKLFKETLVKILKKEKTVKKHLFNFINYRKLLNDSYKIYKNESIASIDCEYSLKKNVYRVSEIGYAIKNLKNKKLNTRHFIVEENL